MKSKEHSRNILTDFSSEEYKHLIIRRNVQASRGFLRVIRGNAWPQCFLEHIGCWLFYCMKCSQYFQVLRGEFILVKGRICIIHCGQPFLSAVLPLRPAERS